jgi:hypothetical protein
MMRKIFGGAMAFSVVGAVLLGGVLAWQASDAVHSQNQVGSGGIDVDIDDSWPGANGPDGVIIGPNGHETDVALLDIENTGTFNLKFACTDPNMPGTCVTGVVVIDEVSPSGLPDETTCGSHNFSGYTKFHLANGNSFLAGEGNLGDELNDALKVVLGVAETAPLSCQNDWVSWTAVVQMVTVGN